MSLEEIVNRWALFDSETYLSLNPDLREGWHGSPASHFARYGMWEGRSFSSPLHVARTLAGAALKKDDPERAETASRPVIPKHDLTIYVSSSGNFFMREIAHQTATGLARLGWKVSVADENSLRENDGSHCLVVAPHEFFRLGNGVSWNSQDFIQRCVMLSTEQPQTSWFGLSVPYLLNAAGVVELCWQTHRTFRDAGVNSYFHIPGFPCNVEPASFAVDLKRTKLIRSLPEEVLKCSSESDDFDQRPLDVAFMGTESILRDEFFSGASATLARLKSFILYRRLAGIPTPYGSDAEIVSINRYILNRSKVLLNIHRDEFGYFEIHRMAMQGMWHGALVVTNRCLPHPVFKPGEHFLEETVPRIPKLLEWLVTTSEGQREGERVRRNAYSTYVQELSIDAQSRKLAQFLHRSYCS
ncbi:hypothetical protein [Bradyrhizobium sp. USDA 4504]